MRMYVPRSDETRKISRRPASPDCYGPTFQSGASKGGTRELVLVRRDGWS